mmetsp:Transcript_12307/g.34876  ORF Transcript_12307/g.34876 Transcript_12307/m.34876 type:complete len:261 (-) Transcript_12307:409-1191(-)
MAAAASGRARRLAMGRWKPSMGTTRHEGPKSRSRALAAVVLPLPGMPARPTISGLPSTISFACSSRPRASPRSQVSRGPASRRPRKAAAASTKAPAPPPRRSPWPPSSMTSCSTRPSGLAAIASAMRAARARASTDRGTYSSSAETATSVGTATWPRRSRSSSSLRSEENMSSSVMRPVSEANLEAVTTCGGPSSSAAALGIGSSPRPSATMAAASARCSASSAATAAPPSGPESSASRSLTGACRMAAHTFAACWPPRR